MRSAKVNTSPSPLQGEGCIQTTAHLCRSLLRLTHVCIDDYRMPPDPKVPVEAHPTPRIHSPNSLQSLTSGEPAPRIGSPNSLHKLTLVPVAAHLAARKAAWGLGLRPLNLYLILQGLRTQKTLKAQIP